MHLSSKLNLASTKKRHLARCIRWSCLLVRELSTATTAILSQWHVTCWPHHWCPHTTEAMMMGIISFTAMGRLADGPSHRSWNHCLLYHAPQPHVPDASEANSGPGWAVQLVTAAMPFHDCANVLKWLALPCICSRFIMLRKNDRPGLTTLHAWLRVPISDSSSRLVHAFLSPHSRSSSCTRCSFAGGSRNSPVTESISMPRKVMHVVGPSVLWAANGTRNSVHVRESCSRLRPHLSVPGLPSTMKSSR